MKEGLRAILVLSAALACGSCAWVLGARDHEPEMVPESELPRMRRIPPWIRPPARELARSEELRAAVDLMERGEFMPAAVTLQRLRSAPGALPEMAAMQSWSLGEAGSPAEAEQVARAGVLEFGQDLACLQYALAVASELSGKHEAAYQAYLRVLVSQPADAVILRACGRTALAAGQPAAAVTFFDRLALQGADDLETAEMRAAALAGAGDFGSALDVYESLVGQNPQDPQLLARMASAAFSAARASGQAEHRRRAGILLVRLTEADPQHGDAFRMLGMNSAAAGDLAGAEAALRRTLEIKPAQLDAGLLLAKVLADRSQRHEARLVLQELLRQPLTRAEVDEIHQCLLQLGPE